jgi:hypothetical protein
VAKKILVEGGFAVIRSEPRDLHAVDRQPLASTSTLVLDLRCSRCPDRRRHQGWWACSPWHLLLREDRGEQPFGASQRGPATPLPSAHPLAQLGRPFNSNAARTNVGTGKPSV